MFAAYLVIHIEGTKGIQAVSAASRTDDKVTAETEMGMFRQQQRYNRAAFIA